MKTWKPLLASLMIVALAWAGMALLRERSPGGGDGPGREAAPEAKTPEDSDESGYRFVTEPLADLPALDPPELWPRDGYRITSPVIDVSWRTTEHSKCRLLASTNGYDWHEVGHSGGRDHWLPLELSTFGGKAFIAVEFDDRGNRYRSTPRRIEHAWGAVFARREYTLNLDEHADLGLPVKLRGRVASDLPIDSYRFTWFTLARPGVYLHGDDGEDTLRVIVANPDEVPAVGAMGFIELYDALAGDRGAYDRIRLYIRR